MDRSDEPDQSKHDALGVDADHALARLEDVLHALPYDRALPDLERLLDRAGVPEELLRRDDRVLKVLHEAILARPFAHVEDVTRVRTEVELLTLEVEVLTDRLADPSADADTLQRATARLDQVRSRLHQVRGRL